MSPTDRDERPRYIATYYLYHRRLEQKELWRVLTDTLSRLYGLQGSLDMGLFLPWLDDNQPVAVFRTSHKCLDQFFTITYFVTEYTGKPLVLVPWKTSGTLEKVKREVNKQDWSALLLTAHFTPPQLDSQVKT